MKSKNIQSKILSDPKGAEALLKGKGLFLGCFQGMAIPVGVSQLLETMHFDLYSYRLSFVPYEGGDKLLIQGIETLNLKPC
jgi:hypothetical protein